MKYRFFLSTGFDSNVIVLYKDNSAIVVDTTTGKGETLHDVISFVKKFDDVTIILTHIHIDHSGGAAYLTEELSADVYIHKQELDALRTGDPHLSAAFLGDVDFSGVEGAKALPDHIDLEGERIDVIHTPGHTPGSVVLHIPHDRVLISGDTVFSNHMVGRWDLPGGNYRKLRKSIIKIMALDFDVFYPGHGPPGTKETDLPPFL